MIDEGDMFSLQPEAVDFFLDKERDNFFPVCVTMVKVSPVMDGSDGEFSVSVTELARLSFESENGKNIIVSALGVRKGGMYIINIFLISSISFSEVMRLIDFYRTIPGLVEIIDVSLTSLVIDNLLAISGNPGPDSH